MINNTIREQYRRSENEYRQIIRPCSQNFIKAVFKGDLIRGIEI